MAKDPKSDEAGGKDAPLRIGTRSSQLALWQATFVKERLAEEGYEAELITISTQGDKDRNSPFSSMSGSAFFTKAIEEALLAGEVDIAVHSHKDLETTPTPGTSIAAIPQRADPADLLLVHPEHKRPDPFLPIARGGTVGSSSPRRQEQLRMFRPDLRIEELRGNVPTRIQKLRDGEYSAILLAKAGIDRLEAEISDLNSFRLPPQLFISAPAQGGLAVQVRAEDELTKGIVQKLHHEASGTPCHIEREILQRFRGGCQLPMGAHCREEEKSYRIWSTVLTEGREAPRRVELAFPKDEEGIPDRVVARLLSEETRKIWISKDLSSDHWWVEGMRKNGQEVHPCSLIRQEPLPFEAPQEADAIFFSSRNGVRYFLERAGERMKEKPLCAYGPGTAEALGEAGLEAAFIGEGGPETVAGSLAEWLEEKGMKKLLLPGPEAPANTIPAFLKERTELELEQLPVYRSLPKEAPALPGDVDTLIFSSPSNVEAFQALGRKIGDEKVLAIGPSTANALKERFPEVPVLTPSSPSLLGLFERFFASLKPYREK